MSASGIRSSCSPTPGTGFVVHRGTTLNPVISKLPRRVAAPPGACRDILSLHEERVGGEPRALPHGHAVVDERPDPDGAAGANRGAVALERAVLLRVALDLAAVIEDGF